MKKGAKAAQKDAKVQQEEKRRRGSLTDNSLGTSSSSISSDEIPVTAKETMTMTEPMDENKAISRQEQEKLLTALVGYGIAGTGLHDVEKDKVGQYNPTDDNGKKMLLYSAVVGDLMINYEYTDPTVSVSRFQPSFFEEWVDVRQNGLMFKNFKLIGKTPPPQVIRLCQLILNGENHLLGTYLPTSQPGTWEYSSFPRQRMIESILGCLVFAPNNFTIIHFLSAEWSPRRHPKMTCNETHHSNCKLLQILFNSIPAELVKEWISRQETAKGRTALHYIAMFGSTCVLDVFKPYLDNKMLNCEDFSKISPLLYAVIGNNFPVMRWLMTNGCDMSFSAIGRTALDKSAERQKCLGWPYVNNRLKALDRCMNAWIGYGYEDQFKLMGAVSDISTMYLTQAREKIDLNIQIREKNMRTALALGEVSLVMFAVPVSYSDWEPYMPDKYPHIMRTKLTDRNGQVTNIFKSVLLIDSSTTVLKSTQNNFDVGMYAWFLSKNVVTNDPSIAMDVDMSYVKNFFNQIIFVQIFAVKVVSAPPVAGPMKSGKKEKTD